MKKAGNMTVWLALGEEESGVWGWYYLGLVGGNFPNSTRYVSRCYINLTVNEKDVWLVELWQSYEQSKEDFSNIDSHSTIKLPSLTLLF